MPSCVEVSARFGELRQRHGREGRAVLRVQGAKGPRGGGEGHTAPNDAETGWVSSMYTNKYTPENPNNQKHMVVLI